MNALTLVNSAIRESGLDLDSLTSGEYATPPEAMHERMIAWVNQAWKDIQLERGEWEFMSGDATYTIYPRLYFELGDRASTPPLGSTFTGETTGANFTAVNFEIISGTFAANTAEGYVDFESLEGQWKLDEYFNEVTPTPADSVFKITDWGRYDLNAGIADLDEPNLNAFYLQSTGSSTTQDNTTNFDLQKIEFVPWAIWKDNYEEGYGSPGRPRLFTIVPNGHYDFWPRPDQEYIVKFDYSKDPSVFADYDDEPTNLPSHVHDIIFWRAVMYYADYERQPDLLRRATNRYNFYKRILDRNLKPVFSWPRNRFNGR